MNINTNPSANLRPRRRAGAADVEFAVCLPLVVGVVFGSIELSNAILVKQALTSAAYEAGNVVSAVGGTSDDAVARANAVLSGFRIKSATVSISPTVDSNTTTGTVIVITCSAPMKVNSMTNWNLQNMVLSKTYTIPHM